MSVYRRKDGKSWRAEVWHNYQRVASRTFRTKADAEAFFNTTTSDLLRDELRLRPASEQPITFRELARLFLDSVKAAVDAKSRRPRTYAGYRSRLAASLAPHFGHQLARHITKADVLKWRDQALAGGHTSQVNHDFDILRAVFNFGAERGIVPGNPCARLKKPEAPEVIRRRIYQPAEVQGLLEKLPPGSDEYGLVLTAFATGLRPASLVALRIEWIDWKLGKLVVPRGAVKNKRQLTIPLAARLVEWLKTLTRDQGPIFGSRQLGREGAPLVDLKSRLADVREHLGEGFALYDCRHTFITHQIRSGVIITDAQRAAGHSDIRTTMIYEHEGPGYLADVRAATEQLVGDGRPKVISLASRRTRAGA